MVSLERMAHLAAQENRANADLVDPLDHLDPQDKLENEANLDVLVNRVNVDRMDLMDRLEGQVNISSSPIKTLC